MRKLTVIASIAVAAAGVALAAPANAGTTGATFTLAGNGAGLAISQPANGVNLGSASTGAASLSGSLGTVQVTDTRGSLVAAWTATVGSTAFTTGTATTEETVAAALISYSSGTATKGTGQVGAMTPSVAVTLAAPAVAGVWAGTGNNTVSWNPTLSFTLLPSQVAGTYAGTITHSVA
ncbi:MAG: hypothetical protein H0V92_10920 [Pseudonocardiales bacterium]|nr:hypothetical protein [Pseudonocardiales bacterium]